MATWLRSVLRRIRELATAGKVRFTLKALRELAEIDAGLDASDAIGILAALTAADAAGRLRSDRTGEWMYVFKPRAADTVVYRKITLRDECIVVSFHEDEADDDDDA